MEGPGARSPRERTSPTAPRRITSSRAHSPKPLRTTARHTLTPATTFSAVALFDLALPSVLLGRYDVFLNSDTTTGHNVQIQLAQLDTGPVLRLRWSDRVTGQNTIISQVALTPAELAEPQVELELSHDSESSDVV